MDTTYNFDTFEIPRSHDKGQKFGIEYEEKEQYLEVNKTSDITSFEETLVYNEDDCDVLHIHSVICKKFKKNISRLKKEIDEKKYKEGKICLPDNDSQRCGLLKNSIEKLQEELNDIQNQKRIYENYTSGLIEKFHRVRQSVEIFGKEKIADTNSKKRLEIVNTYSKIAQNFIPLIINREKIHRCPMCNVDYENNECPECGNTNMEIIPTFEEKIEQEKQVSNKFSLKNSHITEVINKFIGLNPKKDTSKVVAELNRILIEEKIDPKTCPIHTLHRLMKKNDYSSYYCDIYHIYYAISKQTPPDLSKHEKLIEQKKEEFMNGYHKYRLQNSGKFDVNINCQEIRREIFRQAGLEFPHLEFQEISTAKIRNIHATNMFRVKQLINWE